MTLPLVLLIAVYFLLCVLIANLGKRRKWGYWGYLWSSVLFTPLMGLLFVLAGDAPPKRRRGGRPTRDEAQ